MNSFISTAQASSHISTAQGIITKINDAILFPIIALLMAVAFIIFLYGAFVYVKNANNEAARETGRNHLIYGVIGMLVMLSAFAILEVAAATFGLSTELDNASSGVSSFNSVNTAAPNRSPSAGTSAVAPPPTSPATAAPTPPPPPAPTPTPTPTPVPTPAPALVYPDASLSVENRALFDTLLRPNMPVVPDAPVIEKYNELRHPSQHATEVVFIVNWDNTFDTYASHAVCAAIPGTSSRTIELGSAYAGLRANKSVFACMR